MEQLPLYIILLTLSALLYAYLYKTSGKKNLPPSPPALPILGNLHQLSPLIHRSLRELSTKYGPAMHLKFGSLPVLIVSSAAVAKEIMKTHDLAFANKPAVRATQKILYDLKDLINLPYGDHWRKLRAIFMHDLLGTKRVNSFDSVRDEATSLLVDKIRISASDEAPINLTDMFAMLANDLICRLALGKKHNETRLGKKVVEAADKAVKLVTKFTVGNYVPWLSWINRINGFNAAVESCAKEVDEIIDEIIEEHLSKGENKGSGDKESFVDILVNIYKGNVPGVSIDLVSVKALIFDTFGAGTDTSAKAMEWIVTELVRHPKIMKKLQDEVREVMKGKRKITKDDVQKMDYLKAVTKESFRLHPPVPIYFHAAREYVKLMGYDVEPGTMVVINAWAIGQDPEIWEEPGSFMPERFLNSSIDYMGFDFELIPFGAGRRICPGLGFASMNIEHTVANLVRNFDFVLPGGARGEELDVTEKPGLTIGKKEPLIVVPIVVPSCLSS